MINLLIAESSMAETPFVWSSSCCEKNEADSEQKGCVACFTASRIAEEGLRS